MACNSRRRRALHHGHKALHYGGIFGKIFMYLVLGDRLGRMRTGWGMLG